MAGNKSPVFDWEKGEFLVDSGVVKVVEDDEALEQIVIKAYQTPRGKYLIYADTENEDLHHKYGNDTQEILLQPDLTDAAKQSELKRAAKEAIVYDPWIKEVNDVSVNKTGTAEIKIDCTIKTVYDKVIEVKGVTVNG